MRYEIDRKSDGRVSVYVYTRGNFFNVAMHGTRLYEHDSELFGHCLDVYVDKLYIGGIKRVDITKITRKEE